MNSVTYRLQTELDFQKVILSLQDSNITFTSRKYSDSSFPGVAHSDGFGDITVTAGNEAALRLLIESETNTTPVRVNEEITNHSRKGVNVWQVILIIYALGVTVACARFWYLEEIRSEDKNNTSAWSWDGKELVAKRKETGRRSSVSRDANYDLNFELVVSYSRAGIRIAEWRDLNEDGYYEETYLFDAKGKYNGTQYDRNNDGLSEEAVFITPQRDTVKFVDSDKDGIFDVPSEK